MRQRKRLESLGKTLDFLFLTFLAILFLKNISEDRVEHNDTTAVLKVAPNYRMLHTALWKRSPKDIFKSIEIFKVKMYIIPKLTLSFLKVKRLADLVTYYLTDFVQMPFMFVSAIFPPPPSLELRSLCKILSLGSINYVQMTLHSIRADWGEGLLGARSFDLFGVICAFYLSDDPACISRSPSLFSLTKSLLSFI